jgi:superfamily II DNA/RNA helicase
LLDLIRQDALRLDAVTTVVLDEADRMADMGFLPDVRQLLDATSSDRQTLLFSATLDGDVDRLVDRYQRHPAIHDVVPADIASGRVDHLFWRVEPADRVRTTAEIVDRLGSTIVFCRTKHGVDRVARQLGQWNVKAAAIHGDRSQGQRQKALDDFEAGKVAALVATDVAARGIHVDDVGAVVHFDPPADHKDYRHRSGRTGRAGRDGTVITLVVAKMAPAVSALQLTLGLPETTSPNGTWPGDLRVDTPAPGGVGGVAVVPSRLAASMGGTSPQASPR